IATSEGSSTDSASSAKAIPAGSPGPSLSPTLWLNIGMNAAENAPSANKARNMLGIRQATANASDAKLAPTNCANSMSRTNPSTRLAKVSPPTDPSERARFIRFAPRPASGVGRSFRRRLFASAVGPLDAFRLLRLQLLEIRSGKIDRIEQERREATAADCFGDDLARERGDQ